MNGAQAITEFIMNKGFTQAEADKAIATMVKLKVGKFDAHSGHFDVKHGAFLEADAIRNAVNYKRSR